MQTVFSGFFEERTLMLGQAMRFRVPQKPDKSDRVIMWVFIYAVVFSNAGWFFLIIAMLTHGWLWR